MSADWNDVEASVKVALGQVGIASLRVDRSEPGRRTYSLITPLDEPGTLTIQRLAPADQPDPVPISISCTIGRFGDPKREAELVRRVAERLGQLRGVEVAPITR